MPCSWARLAITGSSAGSSELYILICWSRARRSVDLLIASSGVDTSTLDGPHTARPSMKPASSTRGPSSRRCPSSSCAPAGCRVVGEVAPGGDAAAMSRMPSRSPKCWCMFPSRDQRLARASTTGAGGRRGAVGADARCVADDEQRHARAHDLRLGVEEAGAGEGDACRRALRQRLGERQPPLVPELLLQLDELVVHSLPAHRQQREPDAGRAEEAAVRIAPDEEGLEAEAHHLPRNQAPLLAAGGDLDLGKLAHGDRSQGTSPGAGPGLRRRGDEVADLVGVPS